MKRLADIKPVGRRWHETPTDQRLKAVQAALKSGLLRVGDYYSARFAQRLCDHFHLLGPDYDDLWFEPVEGVPVGIVRLAPHEQPPATRTMLAFRLYNESGYRRTWGHPPYGAPPEPQ